VRAGSRRADEQLALPLEQAPVRGVWVRRVPSAPVVVAARERAAPGRGPERERGATRRWRRAISCREY